MSSIISIALPEYARTRLGQQAPLTLDAMGNRDLLEMPLVGLLCSRQCPGNVILETVDLVPEWVKTGRVIVSGFHAPLEQQVLRSLLRRSGRAVKVLARSAEGYRATPAERNALSDKRLLVVSSFPSSARRVTRDSALARNRLVLALSSEPAIPYLSPGSALLQIVSEHRAYSK